MLIKIPPNFLVAEIIGYIKREECDSGSKAVWGKEEEEEEKDDVTGKDDGKF
jgi:hypothetical protein